MTTTVKDEKNYERLSKPFPSKTDATAAVAGFFADVIKARQKWKIADAVCVCAVAVEGEKDAYVNMYRMGSSSLALVLFHRGLGLMLQDFMAVVVEAEKMLEAQS